MKKKLIVLAVAAAVAAPMAAMADATIYGKVRIALEHVDAPGDADKWDLNSYASRLGVKGSEDLGDGLKAIYKLEFQVYPVDHNTNIVDGDGGDISYRNAYVGLAGGWGTALMGRHDTPLKISTGALDLFADTAADYNTTIGFHDVRADNAVAYVSPNLSGFTLAAAIVPAGTSTAGAGTNPDANDIANAYSLAAIYGNGPWHASLAYEDLDEDILGATDSWTKWRIGLGMMGYNNFTVTGVYENWDQMGNDVDLWQIQAAYDFGANRIKAMYGQQDGDSSSDQDSWAIGLQHNLSKRTDAQLLYTQIDPDGGDNDTDVFALQLNHAF